MNRRFLFFFVFFFLIFVFFFSSKAIVDIKLQELRFYLVKEQLLNYELSSKVLREKIKQMLINKDDYTSEIKNTILESNIMNSDTLVSYPKLTWVDYYGLALVNFVRFVSLKHSLTLVEDQNDMMQIQYAFYMERTRKYAIAAKKYASVSEKFQKSETNENGFVMLHHGFCLAMMGDIEGAIAKLKTTEEIFVGTHFADNARVLINVLLEGEKKKEVIKSQVVSDDKKAELLYQSGNYKEALEIFDRLQRNNYQNYMRARCLEELGRTNEAIQEYIPLTNQTIDKDVAIKANRRLAILGNIYEKNETLATFSKKQAEKLGDQEVVKKVEAGATLVAKSLIVEKLTKEPSQTTNTSEETGIKPEELEELKKEFETFQFEEKKEREEKVEKILPPVQEEIIKQNLFMRFKLMDGKVFECKIARHIDGKFFLENDIFSINIPYELVSSIELNEPPLNPNFGILLEKDNGKKILITKLQKNGEVFLYLGKDSNSIDIEEIKLLTIQN
jgi:tetratricopeptide (TPR) repeat protein